MNITSHQRIFAVVMTLLFLVFILGLIRKKKLKEEYTWLWFLVGVFLLVLVVWERSLAMLSSLIGAGTPLTTLIIFGFFFLILIIIHYSVKISVFNDQIKNLAQQLGLVRKELEDLKREKEEN